MQEIYIIADKDAPRLDSFLAEEEEDLTRSHIKKLIESNLVTINGKCEKPSKNINTGDKIILSLPDPVVSDIIAENIPLDIVYEDDCLAVINKKQGMVVHPASGVYTGTLVNALLYHLSSLSGINGEVRPGIVHRLDKDTSGLLVVAKNDFAHNSLSKQIAEHTARRKYLAVLEGVVKEDEGVLDYPIKRSKKDRKKMALDKDGKRAVTKFKILERFKNNSFAEFELETGRTHQIRVHCKYLLHHPIVGDLAYGYEKQKFKLNGQLLHAYSLSFNHPITNKRMEFKAELPKYFTDVLDKLRKN